MNDTWEEESIEIGNSLHVGIKDKSKVSSPADLEKDWDHRAQGVGREKKQKCYWRK